MRKLSVLAGTCAAAAAVSLSAAPALAGNIRTDTSAAGVHRLLFSEARQPDPADPTKTKPVAEVNKLTVTLAGGFYVVTDAGTALTPGHDCQAVTSNQVKCLAAGVTSVRVSLGLLNDTFDNQTATPAHVTGDGGSDEIINAGAGDDVVDVKGNEADSIDSCGAGNDSVITDNLDTINANAGCEVVNGVAQGGSPPPGGGGAAPPPGAPPINPSPPGTPLPVPVSALGVAPTAKPGACVVRFIGTAAVDRIDGSAQGDFELGMAGNDYLRGQNGDDCLYGMDGSDTLLGEAGADLLVGGNGTDLLRGDPGNDRLYGSAGNDRLYGDAGDDRLSGGLGDDRIRGGSGKDQIFGGPGNDLIDAGPGNDVISGGAGRDHIIAGPGTDTINVHDHQRDIVNCGPGRDAVIADRIDVLRNCERVTRRR